MRRPPIAIVVVLLLGVTALAENRTQSACSAWQDSFNTGSLDTSRWTVASGPAPGSIANLHSGNYDSSNVTLDRGMLVLALTQVNGQVGTNPSGVISHGAMISSNAVCGYGTYEWTIKMSSTAICPTCSGQVVPGSVSAGFIYVNNSQTEIDFEASGADDSALWLVNWLNPNPKRDPVSNNGTSSKVSPFFAASFVWARGKISFYIDGLWVADHTADVPSAPAHFMINHWGADSPYWGGLATTGVARFMYITHASYTPPRTSGAQR